MEQKLIDEYSKQFDEYSINQNRKSTISQEHKAIAWRMSFIIANVIWGYKNPNYENINEVFKKLKFPYNENSFEKFIDNSYEYKIFDEDEVKDNVNGKLLLEYSTYIDNIEKQNNINWFKEYCDDRRLACTLNDDAIATLIDEYLYELVKEYTLPKKQEFLLLDDIFKIIPFPKNEASFKKLENEFWNDEIQEALEEL